MSSNKALALMRKHVLALVLALHACASGASKDQPAPTPPKGQSGIEYSSPEEAQTALRQKPGVHISERNGWTIISDKETLSLWSFSPASHAAHPSVVKHYLVESDGKKQMRMGVICNATKDACDAMVREFQAATSRTVEQMKGAKP